MYWKQDILDTYPWIKYGMAEISLKKQATAT